MKTILLAVLCVLSSIAAGQTTFWVEPQVIVNSVGNTRRVDAGVYGSFTERVGYFAFGQVLSTGYAQAYAGPNAKLSCFEIGIGAGVEDAEPSFRRAAYLSASCGKVSLLGIIEDGGSGRFRKLVATYQLSEKWKAGVMGETYLGFGPRVEYAFGKNHSLGIGILWDRDTKTLNGVVAFPFNF